jgi:YfiH family protein
VGARPDLNNRWLRVLARTIYSVVARVSERMLQAATLATLERIRHAFFTRSGGVSEGVYASLNGGVGSRDTPDKVAENRARMAAVLGVTRIACSRRIKFIRRALLSPMSHGPGEPSSRGCHRHACAAIGHRCVDCRLWTIAVRRRAAGVIGAAHAGWRGALTGVIEATIAAMERLGAERDRISVALGPTIRQQNYEVGPEFVERFQTADRTNANFFAPSQRDGHAMFDLTGYIAQRVERAGITRFEDLGLCTFAEPARFFSYRRTTLHGEPDYGRHVNAIVLAE